MHYDTVMVLGGVLSVLLTGIMALTLRALPTSARPSLLPWLAALALMSLYWWVFLRVEAANDSDLVALLNALLLLALSGQWLAVRRFLGDRPLLWPVLVLVLLALAATLALGPDPERYTARVAIVAIFAAGTLLAVAWALRPSRCDTDAGRLLRLIALTAAALAPIRMVVRVFAPTSEWEAIFDFVALACIFVYPTLASFAFLLMHVERVNGSLQRLAATDALTGALNRRALESLAVRTLSEARRHRRPTSLLMIDADHFKRVNDTYGHEAGDAILVQLTERIGRTLRLEDAVARVGGEEFVVLLPGTPVTEAVRVAERIRSLVRERSFLHGDDEILLTVSIGVAEQGSDEADFEQLLRRADDAMYAAKRAGRDRVRSAPETRQVR